MSFKVRTFVCVKMIEGLPDSFYGIQLSSKVLYSLPKQGLTLSEIRDRVLARDSINRHYLEARTLANLQRRIRAQVFKLENVGLVMVTRYRPPGSLVTQIKVERLIELPEK